MKKFVALALALVLVFSMGVPSFGASIVGVDETLVFLPDKSATNYSVNSAFTNLNILEAIRVLVDSSAYDVHQLKVLFSTGSYKTVADAINLYFNGSASDISSYGNENLYLMQSAFYYLGRTLQGMNYYTPYTDSLVSFDDALNYNLLYITNQLKVITKNLSGASGNSGLMSGWSLSGVPSPDGYSSSWYYSVLRNIYNLTQYFTRLYSGTWADSENYGDSFFYQTYLQNKTLSDNIFNLVNGWSYDLTTIPEEYPNSWYYSVLYNLYGSYENSELFEETFLTKKYKYRYIHPGQRNFVTGDTTFADAVTSSLNTIGTAFTQPVRTSFSNPFSSSGTTTVSHLYGFVGELITHENYQSEFLARLAYVLADDEEIRMNETIQDSKAEVVDFIGEGVTSSSGSSLSLMSGITDGISFATDFNEYFSMPDVGIGDIFGVFSDTSESLSWFTEETASNIDTVPVTYSREPNPRTEVVTSYYEDRKSEFNDMWGDIVG